MQVPGNAYHPLETVSHEDQRSLAVPWSGRAPTGIGGGWGLQMGCPVGRFDVAWTVAPRDDVIGSPESRLVRMSSA